MGIATRQMRTILDSNGVPLFQHSVTAAGNMGGTQNTYDTYLIRPARSAGRIDGNGFEGSEKTEPQWNNKTGCAERERCYEL